MNKPLSNKQQ